VCVCKRARVVVRSLPRLQSDRNLLFRTPLRKGLELVFLSVRARHSVIDLSLPRPLGLPYLPCIPSTILLFFVFFVASPPLDCSDVLSEGRRHCSTSPRLPIADSRPHDTLGGGLHHSKIATPAIDAGEDMLLPVSQLRLLPFASQTHSPWKESIPGLLSTFLS